ncbi:MAG: RNA-directed DNA polymerase [Achromobacter sp.]|uniref:antiviral reverse transcriptase Drt3a n=1 Tax=Achromobacter sp. TaxID=134375 RepID=UPI0012CA945F|nr:antiviral reverse transcriptase Drt3a [Achromobacter sp.]MPS78652.1 RNA-directed DNA polymerase [Achromobacter sp.]
MSRASSFDQSFCIKTLERVLWRRDFLGVPAVNQATFRDQLLSQALLSANSHFSPPSVPLTGFPLKGKTVYRLTRHQDELVERKLRLNLKKCSSLTVDGRSQIVKNLKLLLEEGVPYRIYRLDIRSFFESFQRNNVLDVVASIKNLSPHSKKLIGSLFDAHAEIGGNGVPRGLSISAVLSEILMQNFDQKVRWSSNTFYYSRYVDDIIIVSSAREEAADFLRGLCAWLPPGLELNPDKKSIVEASARVEKESSATALDLLRFDYLGYQFSVRNPTRSEAGRTKDGELHRKVHVDISRKKIKRIKTRIIRSLLSYSNSSDWALLRDRVAFLTQNFSVYDPKAGGKKIAGIYHSYPLVSEGASGLKELDRFLRNAVLSKKGRVFSITNTMISARQKRQLLTYSFARGHSDRSFIHFSATRISQIQRCWIY